MKEISNLIQITVNIYSFISRLSYIKLRIICLDQILESLLQPRLMLPLKHPPIAMTTTKLLTIITKSQPNKKFVQKIKQKALFAGIILKKVTVRMATSANSLMELKSSSVIRMKTHTKLSLVFHFGGKVTALMGLDAIFLTFTTSKRNKKVEMNN